MLHKYNTHNSICAFSTTRHGGVSTGNYASFNANHYCGDKPENVRENRSLLCKELGIDENCLIVPHQTHEDRTLIINEHFLVLPPEVRKEMLEGIDAVSTNINNVCVCVSTADCIPVLIYDEKRHVVSAVHAGWRGTLQRIVMTNIDILTRTYSINPSECKAVIGPGISLDAFEVGDEVCETFADKGFDMTEIARKYPSKDKQSEKWHIDLPTCNMLQLLQVGFKKENIYLSNICTYTSAQDFFSARRLGVNSGRILNGIMIKGSP